MAIFLAGGTGALGRRLIPQLTSRGHRVIATTTSRAKFSELTDAGAEPVVMDALDARAVTEAVAAARPQIVIHEATSIPKMLDLKHLDDAFTTTNRLRTEGTRNLLNAARAAGALRFIAQSFSGWPNVREGSRVKTEDDPLDPHPPKAMEQTLAAIRSLESLVTSQSDVTGLVLRYGGFYGPGTSLGSNGEMTELVRQRRLPVIGGGAGVWSFIHIDDAARATALAAEGASAGTYNIVDDEPAEVSVWLPELANILGAKPPHHVPALVGRLAVGEAGVSMMTRIRGSSNAKAKKFLNWIPEYATWRDGFRYGLSQSVSQTGAASSHT